MSEDVHSEMEKRLAAIKNEQMTRVEAYCEKCEEWKKVKRIGFGQELYVHLLLECGHERWHKLTDAV